MSESIKSVYKFGPFVLYSGEQLLLKDGRPVRLQAKAFEVLVALIANSPRLVSKEELLKQVWADSFVEDNNVAVCISNIRKALGDDRNGNSYIATVPRRGYRFVACVSEGLSEALSQTNAAPQIKTEVAAAHTQEGIVAARKQTEVYATSDDHGMQKGTVAVLPFKHIGALRNEYLGLGMADALITRLSNLREVTVRPTSSGSQVRRHARSDLGRQRAEGGMGSGWKRAEGAEPAARNGPAH